jgi:hypothetical protein
MECLRLHQPLPTEWADDARLHPAARHLDGAELSMRCVRRAYADDNCLQAAAFCRSAIEDLRAALVALEARQ